MTTYPRLRVTNVVVERANRHGERLYTPRAGRDFYTMMGQCINAGGSVSLRFDTRPSEVLVSGILDWRPDGTRRDT